MHPILFKVQSYLTEVVEGRVEPIPRELLFDFAKSTTENLVRQFGRKKDGFRLRMSNVGRPTCQLQMEASEAVPEPQPYYSSFRNTYGDLTESLAVLVLKAAGVKIISEQERVKVHVADIELAGTLDLVVDEGGEAVWDLKSASGWAFNNKFRDFASVAKDDSFGYVSQGYAYAEAKKLPFGGWIVVNKENGEWTVVQTPTYEDEVKRKSLALIEHNIRTIREKRPFQRSYSDVEETFRRKPTGNRTLDTTCGFCEYKHSCWQGLEYRSEIASSAENPKKKWYTYIDPKYKKEKNAEEVYDGTNTVGSTD